MYGVRAVRTLRRPTHLHGACRVHVPVTPTAHHATCQVTAGHWMTAVPPVRRRRVGAMVRWHVAMTGSNESMGHDTARHVWVGAVARASNHQVIPGYPPGVLPCNVHGRSGTHEPAMGHAAATAHSDAAAADHAAAAAVWVEVVLLPAG